MKCSSWTIIRQMHTTFPPKSKSNASLILTHMKQTLHEISLKQPLGENQANHIIILFLLMSRQGCQSREIT